MSIFNGLDGIVDHSLGLDDAWEGKPPRYRHPTTLVRLCRQNGPDVDGVALVEALYARILQNWAEWPGPDGLPSAENWRFKKRPDYDPSNSSPEVTLERTVASVSDCNWANQVPVDSGLMNARAHFSDLVFRAGTAFTLIELKYESNTPLSAACQVLSYALAYAFFRCHAEQLGVDSQASPILQASELHLRVCAPSRYFHDYGTACSWLSRFEADIDRGAHAFAKKHAAKIPPMSFAFEAFPEDFAWTPDTAGDIPSQKNALWAINRRQRVFPTRQNP